MGRGEERRGDAVALSAEDVDLVVTLLGFMTPFTLL